MSYEVRVPRPISRAIGACGLPRQLLVRLLNRLYDQLPNRADDYRHNRAPGLPECFVMRVVLVDTMVPAWHLCRFMVNDQREPGTLYIEGFTHERRLTG